MSRWQAGQRVFTFAVAFAGALVVLSAFANGQSSGGWTFLAVAVAPLMAVPMIPVSIAAWLRDLRLRRPNP